MAENPAKGHPLWRFDRRCLRGHSAILGVDEAGRGALAGPVVAAVVRFDNRFYLHPRCRRLSRSIYDSKGMNPGARQTAYAYIEEWTYDDLMGFAWAFASVNEVENYNVLGATRLAMERALHKLGESLPVPGEDVPVLGISGDTRPKPRLMVDGRPLRPFPYRHEGVVGGDRQSLAIAAASVVAKVVRDRLMTALGETWPAYGFSRHKGYGTREHRNALLSHGPCAEHRLSFLNGILKVEEPAAIQEYLAFNE